jgi:hypothetical protein
MKPGERGWGLFRRRECLLPTWRGWLVILLLGAGLVVIAIRGAYSFLAITKPVAGGVLVVEGWLPDYALEETIVEFRRGHFRMLYVTGGPVENGAPLAGYKSLAELCAATLVELGMDTNAVQAVPAAKIRRDRTYASAIALKNWMHRQGIGETNLNIVTIGPHARRSRLLFREALGPGYRVGVIAFPDRSYDPNQWWETSAGVRAVTGEMIAYGYARLFFTPSSEPE